jgi:hypothetical protein
MFIFVITVPLKRVPCILYFYGENRYSKELIEIYFYQQGVEFFFTKICPVCCRLAQYRSCSKWYLWLHILWKGVVQFLILQYTNLSLWGRPPSLIVSIRIPVDQTLSSSYSIYVPFHKNALLICSIGRSQHVSHGGQLPHSNINPFVICLAKKWFALLPWRPKAVDPRRAVEKLQLHLTQIVLKWVHLLVSKCAFSMKPADFWFDLLKLYSFMKLTQNTKYKGYHFSLIRQEITKWASANAIFSSSESVSLRIFSLLDALYIRLIIANSSDGVVIYSLRPKI